MGLQELIDKGAIRVASMNSANEIELLGYGWDSRGT